MAQADRIDADPSGGAVRYAGRRVAVDSLRWDVPTRGTVLAIMRNYRGALATIRDSALEAAQAPMLYVKPANTWIGYGAPIPLPADVAAVEAGASLGIVIGATASRIDIADAEDFIAGYTIVNDLGEPGGGSSPPTLRQRCRDGFCAIGPWVIARHELPRTDALGIRVRVNGNLVCEDTTANLIRPVPRLLAEVTSFMTLCAGDVLLTGIPEGAPLVRRGDRVRVEIEGVGALENPVVAEEDFVAGDRP